MYIYYIYMYLELRFRWRSINANGTGLWLPNFKNSNPYNPGDEAWLKLTPDSCAGSSGNEKMPSANIMNDYNQLICIYIYTCVQHYSTQKMTTLIIDPTCHVCFFVRSPWNQSCWARFFTSTRGMRTTAPCCWVMDSVYPRIPMTEGQGCWWTRWMTVYMCTTYIYIYIYTYL